MNEIIDFLLKPTKLWSYKEVFQRNSRVPKAGIYGWYFKSLPPKTPKNYAPQIHGYSLLYIGISPSNTKSSNNIHRRIKTHYKGNASGSTLRLTLGCLLAEELNLKLQQTGEKNRLTFKDGEKRLSAWMEENAFVCWFPKEVPWEIEKEIIGILSPLLNLHHNSSGKFYKELSKIRRRTISDAQTTDSSAANQKSTMQSTEFGGGEIVLFQAEDGRTRLEVGLRGETVWLTQEQMAVLFDRERSVVTKHLRNVFREGELSEAAVCAKNAHTAVDGKIYQTQFYNLDAILSVGYRVNSRRGTQFRQWATRILREHIVKGYTLNEQRLREEAAKLREMQQAVELLTRTLANQELVTDTGRDVLRVITDYAYALTLLDRYDHGTLVIEETTRQALHVIDYAEGIGIVKAMKGEFDGLFGIEKDQGFKSALGAIYQTFGGEELYPSVEEKAANLLYFVVKNHAFSDGNKRIAAALFIYFLGRNAVLYRPDGSKRLADNALVALTLLIAESRPDEKDTIVKVIVNLINRNND